MQCFTRSTSRNRTLHGTALPNRACVCQPQSVRGSFHRHSSHPVACNTDITKQAPDPTAAAGSVVAVVVARVQRLLLRLQLWLTVTMTMTMTMTIMMTATAMTTLSLAHATRCHQHHRRRQSCPHQQTTRWERLRSSSLQAWSRAAGCLQAQAFPLHQHRHCHLRNQCPWRILIALAGARRGLQRCRSSSLAAAGRSQQTLCMRTRASTSPASSAARLLRSTRAKRATTTATWMCLQASAQRKPDTRSTSTTSISDGSRAKWVKCTCMSKTRAFPSTLFPSTTQACTAGSSKLPQRQRTPPTLTPTRTIHGATLKWSGPCRQHHQRRLTTTTQRQALAWGASSGTAPRISRAGGLRCRQQRRFVGTAL